MSGAPVPTPVGAVDAVAYSRRFTTWKPKGMCANHVASCYSDGLRLTRFGVASAIDAWNKAVWRETSTNPPFGAPVYWESGEFGHIAISVGGGRVRSTDWPVNEQLGECTIEQMGRRWPNMRYLGWSRDMAGRPIPGLEKVTTNPATVPEEDDFMAMTPAERQDLINDIRDAILNAVVPNHDGNGDGKPDGEAYFKSYSVMANYRASRLQIEVAAVRKAIAEVAAKVGVDVDEKAIATALAASLAPVVRDAVLAAAKVTPSISDADAAKLSDAVVARLGSALTS